VRERNGFILIAPFKPSISLDNLLRERIATINTTDDVRVFAGALTGRRDWLVERSGEALVLESALSYKVINLEKMEEDEQRPKLYFKVIQEETLKSFQGYNRAQAAVVDLCVLVSRLHLLPIDKIISEMEYLRIAIEKTAGVNELEAWEWLVEAVDNHCAQFCGDNFA